MKKPRLIVVDRPQPGRQCDLDDANAEARRWYDAIGKARGRAVSVEVNFEGARVSYGDVAVMSKPLASDFLRVTLFRSSFTCAEYVVQLDSLTQADLDTHMAFIAEQGRRSGKGVRR